MPSGVEAVWARMQVELLNRKKWHTRVELANAMFEYLEIFHNRQRRHSALGMHTPIEYEISTRPVNPRHETPEKLDLPPSFWGPGSGVRRRCGCGSSGPRTRLG